MGKTQNELECYSLTSERSNIIRTNSYESTGHWYSRSKWEKLLFVWCFPRICETWYCSQNLLDSSFALSDLSSMDISILSSCGPLRVIYHTTTSFHFKRLRSGRCCAYPTLICKYWFSSVHVIYLHKNKICLSVIFYCRIIMKFCIMVIIGNLVKKCRVNHWYLIKTLKFMRQ